jgi:hypothetical protein
LSDDLTPQFNINNCAVEWVAVVVKHYILICSGSSLAMTHLAFNAPFTPVCPEQGLIQQIQRWGDLAVQTSLQLQALQQQMGSDRSDKGEDAQTIHLPNTPIAEERILQLAQESLKLAHQATERSQIVLNLAQKATTQLKTLRA